MNKTQIRKSLRIVFLASITLATGNIPAMAQDAPAAIGLITYGDTPKPGDAICTGTLVARQLVLTAGHCVRDAASNPSTIHFAPAATRNKPHGSRQGIAVILPKVQPNQPNPFSGDVGLVVLDNPFPAGGVMPLPVADPASRRYTVIAYDRDSPQVRHMNADCKVAAIVPGMIGLTCPVVSGNSGAPLLQWTGEQWQAVAVVVASDRNGAVRSWATVIPPDVRQRIATAP